MKVLGLIRMSRDPKGSMSMYKALTYVMVGDRKAAPGESITSEELAAANQTDEDVKKLLETGAISQDANAPLHPDHADLEPPKPAVVDPDATHVVDGDAAQGASA